MAEERLNTERLVDAIDQKVYEETNNNENRIFRTVHNEFSIYNRIHNVEKTYDDIKFIYNEDGLVTAEIDLDMINFHEKIPLQNTYRIQNGKLYYTGYVEEISSFYDLLHIIIKTNKRNNGRLIIIITKDVLGIIVNDIDTDEIRYENLNHLFDMLHLYKGGPDIQINPAQAMARYGNAMGAEAEDNTPRQATATAEYTEDKKSGDKKTSKSRRRRRGRETARSPGRSDKPDQVSGGERGTSRCRTKKRIIRLVSSDKLKK